MIEYKFSLELTKNGVQKSLHSKSREDVSRRMIITLTDKGDVYDLTDKTVRVFFDDNTFLDTATIENNRIIFDIPKAMVAVAGKRICEFKISEGEMVLYSPAVEVVVEGSIEGDNAQELIGQSNEIVTKAQLDSAVAVVQNYAKGIEEDVEEIKQTNETNQPKIDKIYDVETQVVTNKADIETLKEDSHKHTNKTNILDNLGEDDEGNLTFNGATIKPSADSTQPDWRESNEKSPNYVRNKTHYEYGYYYDATDGVEVDFVSGGDRGRIDEPKKAIKLNVTLEDESELTSLISDWIQLEDASVSVSDEDAQDWWSDSEHVVNNDLGIEYVKKAITRQLRNYEEVTIQPGLYFYTDEFTYPSRVKSIFVCTERKKIPSRFLNEKKVNYKEFKLDYSESVMHIIGEGSAFIEIDSTLMPKYDQILTISFVYDVAEMDIPQLVADMTLYGGASIQVFPKLLEGTRVYENTHKTVAILNDPIQQSVLYADINESSVLYTALRVYYTEA